MTDVPDGAVSNPALELRAELRNWCEAWESCFKNVLTQISGQPTIFEISSEPLSVVDSDVWYTVVAAGAVHGEMVLHLPAASGTLLAQKLLSETEPAAPGITPEHKEALEELLRQVSGLAATALGATAGGEVKLSLAASAAPSWSSDAIVCLQTRDEAGTPISIEIRISPALATGLQPKVSAPAPPPVASSTTSGPASRYRRLMDVGLDVKLRFGIRHMLLRDVLALSAGVVVELENTLHSPVDLLLDGRVIAQGEVVIVDGKYGLRISGVVDPTPAVASPV
jgi:flagellar motor switch protein FliN